MGRGTTKRDMVKRIAAETNTPRPVVRQIMQQFLDDIVDELGHGRRLEFRDFGVFETVERKPRVARNPRTGLAIQVPAKTVVHFKQGRVMRERVAALGPGALAPDDPRASGSGQLPARSESSGRAAAAAGPAPESGPEPESQPEAAPEPGPEAGPEPESAPDPEPEPETKVEPGPGPEPEEGGADSVPPGEPPSAP